MKAIISSAIMLLFLFVANISLALGTEFDISEIEKQTDLFSVFRENGMIFIETNLTSQEKDFSHKNNSEFYYNSIYPDIIVLNPNTATEVAIPRMWIQYRTDNNALSINNVRFIFSNNEYDFSIDNSTITALEKGTIEESILIIIDAESHRFLEDWCTSAALNNPVKVQLIGSSDTVEFEIPLEVASAGKDLYIAFALGGGTASMYDYVGTPVVVKTKNPPFPDGMNVTYCDDTTGTSFKIPNGWSVIKNESDGIWVKTELHLDADDWYKRATIIYIAWDFYQSTLISSGINEDEVDVSRRELDKFLMTKSGIAEIMNVPIEKIRYEKYGNYDYYIFTVTDDYDNIIPGYTINTSFDLYCNVNDGILYMLAFIGDESRFDDYKELLTSMTHDNSESIQGDYRVKIN